MQIQYLFVGALTALTTVSALPAPHSAGSANPHDVTLLRRAPVNGWKTVQGYADESKSHLQKDLSKDGKALSKEDSKTHHNQTNSLSLSNRVINEQAAYVADGYGTRQQAARIEAGKCKPGKNGNCG